MEGAKKYNAIDVNNLVQAVPTGLYEELFEFIDRNIEDKAVDTNHLRSQLLSTQHGKNDKINYLCDKDFDLSIFKDQNIDLVFSQAAFEHFDNVDKTISQLSEIVESGTILVAEVDLRTHTRWIRDFDPLNIYRYGDFIYDLFTFCGSPNRLRPFEYKEILVKNGWTEITIMSLTKLEKEYLLKVNESLNKRFRSPINQMNHLSIMICATKK